MQQIPTTPEIFIMPKDKIVERQYLYLLDKIINRGRMPLILDESEKMVESLLQGMFNDGFIDIDKDSYVPTAKGNEKLVNFILKYKEYLKVFDIFCAVDLAEGTFAFARYFDPAFNETTWQQYLNEDKWFDVRIPVAVAKGLDPTEFVFMHFLNKNRFGQEHHWAFDLVSTLIFDEIVEICDSAYRWEELSEPEGSDDVILDIISQGHELMQELLIIEKNIEEEKGQPRPQVGFGAKIRASSSYIGNYSSNDPHYVSPIWR